MMFKLAVVILALVAVAASQSYTIYNTYPDENCNTTVVARFITADTNACDKKRSVAQESSCYSTEGVWYTVECGLEAVPALPTGWQAVQLTADASCNATAASDTSYLQAPQTLTNASVLIYSPQFQSSTVANVSMSCGTDGVLAVSSCVDIPVKGGNFAACAILNLANGVCDVDNFDTNHGLQTSCVAAPVAAPVASEAPTSTQGPVAAPDAAPVKAPVKAPAKASSASLICGSAAFLSLIALL
eukprot:TRINITY_DN155_c0_g1_i2.p1 TRINITY_DN155_c0_g1~~TRINITY_DN155_c0_g1_i2.p1  ORF type:complete len:244 (+),score=49.01 TRINITY_DN155_c0_g1_i2:23-754(+)